ncbi:hypothetical protein DES32_2917 [Methylovirgula ligni]|uniref:Uncharacterized protein n=1 Tax=Methylovirgula ligni TaxID=569860 RepID=A0A3D9YT57_9HYPH|nr:hypothetical protein DES32_2917 [Methylovirgula ligni]
MRPRRFKPTPHLIAGAVEYEKAIWGSQGMFPFKSGQPLQARRNHHIEVFQGDVFHLHRLGFAPMGYPFYRKHKFTVVFSSSCLRLFKRAGLTDKLC